MAIELESVKTRIFDAAVVIVRVREWAGGGGSEQVNSS